MGIGNLRRHLDLEAVRRVQRSLAGEKIDPPKKKSKKARPRPNDDFRGFRRNAAKGTVWKGIDPDRKLVLPATRQNRSKHHAVAARHYR